MVRKITSVFVVLLMLICAVSTSALASTHSIYENGNLSSTYTTYFRDILNGAKFSDNYVAFRSGQYSYTMVVGDLEYENNRIVADGSCKEYVFSTTSSNYNSQYYYDVNTLNSFSVDISNQIIYSDVGEFPQLLERGTNYEFLCAVILFVALLYFAFIRIYDYSKRRGS